ncbi:helicase associated domain-containing protein [Ohtaekwangia sp.]|uniref:helicase associated domain-containing protein n=1 Tax=Ohtaekwangia sp. TaxID=2066019 RepID=UPI002F93DA5A
MEVWKHNLARLKTFKKKFGHCNVPSQWKEDLTLSRWVENIRNQKHQLPKPLKEELTAMGFNFDYNVIDDWDVMYEKLRAFYRKFGHTEVSPDDAEQELLSSWVKQQRLSHKRLSPEHIRKLDEIEFIWELRRPHYTAQWLRGFERLKAYYHEFGNSRIAWRDSKHSDLFEWSRSQIKRYKGGKLSEDKIRLLNSIEFDWNAGRKKIEEEKWLKKYEELKKFKSTYGHCKVPIRQRALYAWVNINRIKENLLSEDHRKKLNDLGFEWSDQIQNRRGENWDAMYNKLKAFYKKHGHIKVTKRMNPKLHRWLMAQEEKVSITKYRREKLEALGMVWRKDRKKKRDAQWNVMYNKLKKFYLDNGHFVVPIKNQELRGWLDNLKVWNKTLTDAQKQKLKAIKFDFTWRRADYFRLRWDKRYEELKKFKKEFGHAKPSKRTGAYTSLGLWIAWQRKNRHRLSTEQVNKLNRLGFDWLDKK